MIAANSTENVKRKVIRLAYACLPYVLQHIYIYATTTTWSIIIIRIIMRRASTTEI